MPRIENIGANVTAWCDKYGDGSSTYDVCSYHHREITDSPHAYAHKLLPYGTNEPVGDAGWGGDVEHPPYEDEGYCCAVCGRKLTARDN